MLNEVCIIFLILFLLSAYPLKCFDNNSIMEFYFTPHLRLIAYSALIDDGLNLICILLLLSIIDVRDVRQGFKRVGKARVSTVIRQKERACHSLTYELFNRRSLPLSHFSLYLDPSFHLIPEESAVSRD